MRLKISAVAYLNAAPFVYGLQHAPVMQGEDVDLMLDIPAISAQKLRNGDVDVALMPVAAIPQSADFNIITDYCIGAVSTVASVCVFANEPLENLTTIGLDAHSRTSVALVQLLARDYWHLHCNFHQIVDYSSIYNPKSGVGYLLIGDKTFAARPHFSHIYDLAEAWIAYAGRPFVFAAWVARKGIPSSFATMLNEALAYGVGHISETIANVSPRYTNVDVAYYLTNNISYPFDAAKREGLQFFLSQAQQLII